MFGCQQLVAKEPTQNAKMTLVNQTHVSKNNNNCKCKTRMSMPRNAYDKYHSRVRQGLDTQAYVTIILSPKPVTGRMQMVDL